MKRELKIPESPRIRVIQETLVLNGDKVTWSRTEYQIPTFSAIVYPPRE